MPIVNLSSRPGLLTGQLLLPVPTPQDPAKAATPQNNGLTNWVYAMKLAADNTPTQFIEKRVPPGQLVRIRANNGTSANNQQIIFIAQYPGAFAAGAGMPLSPLDDVIYPVDSTGRIFFYGKTGDGIVVSIYTPVGN